MPFSQAGCLQLALVFLAATAGCKARQVAVDYADQAEGARIVEEQLGGSVEFEGGLYYDPEADPPRAAALTVNLSSQPAVKDDSLSVLNRFPALRELQLSGTAVGDKGLAHLAPLAELRVLNLESTRVTDAGLDHLQTLGKLESLDLSHTKVGNAGLQKLTGLSRLRELRLDNTTVSDAGIEYLQQLKQLEIVDLTDTKVTQDGARRLEKALGSVLVIHSVAE